MAVNSHLGFAPALALAARQMQRYSKCGEGLVMSISHSDKDKKGDVPALLLKRCFCGENYCITIFFFLI